MGGGMNAADILLPARGPPRRVGGYGVRLLRFRPVSAVPAELREALRLHKAELLAVLRQRQTVALRDALPCGVAESKPSLLAAEITAMSLAEFAVAGRVVGVVPQVLGEPVVFASDNAIVDPGERRVVYRAAELQELLGLGPADLRVFFTTSRRFSGGTICSSPS